MRVNPSLVASIAALLLSAAPIQAADVEPATASYDWSGLYIGLHAGYIWEKVDYEEPDFPDSDIDRSGDGFIGGAYLGFNHQIDNLVLGAEGDFGLGGVDIDNNEDSFTNSYSSFDTDWNAHIRGRAGFAIDRFLLFVAGGLAITELKVDDEDDGWGDDTQTHFGWTIGGGAEFAASDNVLIRVEYLYDDYGDEDYRITGPVPADDYDVRADLTASTVRVGVEYKFGDF